MLTQALVSGVLTVGRFKLERKDLEACPLGTIGNLQFTAEEGGTARAGYVHVALSGAGRSLVKRLSDLKDCVICAPPDLRAQREDRYEVRNNSLLIGNLLGRLTAPAGDGKGLARTAKALEQLVKLSNGDLDELKGLDYCLITYVDELKILDFDALHLGVLDDEDACQAMLSMIEPADSNEQAAQLLNRIIRTLNQRCLRESAKRSLDEIDHLLSSARVDGNKLKASLLKLARCVNELDAKRTSSGLGGGNGMDICLVSLAPATLAGLRKRMMLGALDKVQQVLSSRISNESEAQQVQAILHRLCASLWSVAYAEVELLEEGGGTQF
ncbi:hypothetical protein [Alcaligenes sp. WGS1538]|uniref:hypothetical protein n=1 Tax=Alcaligenes sp. WGS1538 TaxID=3366811 RepID=UPI00372D38E1